MKRVDLHPRVQIYVTSIMNIEQAEKERCVRFYKFAVESVRRDVASGFPMLHMLNRSEDERRSVDSTPSTEIEARWLNSVTLSHRVASRILNVHSVVKEDFRPVVHPQIHSSNVSNSSSGLDVWLSYYDNLEEEFGWNPVSSESKVMKTALSDHYHSSSKYDVEFGDWKVSTSFGVDSIEDTSTGFYRSCSVIMRFRIIRTDCTDRNCGMGDEYSPYEWMRYIDPFSFFGLTGDGWFLFNWDESEHYKKCFSSILKMFYGMFQEILPDLSIDS